MQKKEEKKTSQIKKSQIRRTTNNFKHLSLFILPDAERLRLLREVVFVS